MMGREEKLLGKTWGECRKEETTPRRMRRRSQERAAKLAWPLYLLSSDGPPVPPRNGCFPGRMLATASAAGRDTSSRWSWQETSERRVRMRSRLGKALKEEQQAPSAPSPQPAAALLAFTWSKTPLPSLLWGQDPALPQKPLASLAVMLQAPPFGAWIQHGVATGLEDLLLRMGTLTDAWL